MLSRMWSEVFLKAVSHDFSRNILSWLLQVHDLVCSECTGGRKWVVENPCSCGKGIRRETKNKNGCTVVRCLPPLKSSVTSGDLWDESTQDRNSEVLKAHAVEGLDTRSLRFCNNRIMNNFLSPKNAGTCRKRVAYRSHMLILSIFAIMTLIPRIL